MTSLYLLIEGLGGSSGLFNPAEVGLGALFAPFGRVGLAEVIVYATAGTQRFDRMEHHRGEAG